MPIGITLPKGIRKHLRSTFHAHYVSGLLGICYAYLVISYTIHIRIYLIKNCINFFSFWRDKSNKSTEKYSIIQNATFSTTMDSVHACDGFIVNDTAFYEQLKVLIISIIKEIIKAISTYNWLKTQILKKTFVYNKLQISI